MNTAAFILIIFAHVGTMGSGNSNALTVAEFTTAERCAAAGKAARALASGTVKQVEWVCMPK